MVEAIACHCTTDDVCLAAYVCIDRAYILRPTGSSIYPCMRIGGCMELGTPVCCALDVTSSGLVDALAIVLCGDAKGVVFPPPRSRPMHYMGSPNILTQKHKPHFPIQQHTLRNPNSNIFFRSKKLAEKIS